MMDEYAIPPELLTEAEDMMKTGFNLKAPATVQRKNGYARWTEYVSIENAYREDVAAKEEKPARTIFTLKMKVLPFDTDSPNVGRNKTEFFRINFAALKGQGSDSERKMSMMSVSRLRQVAVANGLDLSAGLSGEMIDLLFPLQGTEADMVSGSPLVGQHFAITLRDNANKKYREENEQGVEMFAPAPEGV